jgi:hypothetical protein
MTRVTQALGERSHRVILRLAPVDDMGATTTATGVRLSLPHLLRRIDRIRSVLAKRELGPNMRSAAEIAGVIAGLLLVLPIAVDVLIALLVAAGLATLGDRRSARWVLKREFVNLFRRIRGLEPIDQEPPGLERR